MVHPMSTQHGSTVAAKRKHRMIRLFIGNKNYSSWSLRAWLTLSRCAVSFEEVLIPLDQTDTAARIRTHSPSGRVPVLDLNGLQVWDSLAIAESLAEHFPAAKLWPATPAARAHARSVSAEMHAGFAALRRELPMNMRARRRVEASVAAQFDIERVQALLVDCRMRYHQEGAWLFGAWSIADAFYAPVVSRFLTYGVAFVEQTNRDRQAKLLASYIETVRSDPAYAAWVDAAKHEPEVVEADEAGSELH